MSTLAGIVDRVLEGPVVPSFTNIGYEVRKRSDGWTPLDDYDLTGRTVAITGPTSGLGLAATRQMASMGASLVLIARNEEKVSGLAGSLRDEFDDLSVSYHLADLGEFETIHDAAGEISNRYEKLDVLIHNAGSLFNERRVAGSGLELTTAVQVVGPFLMTSLLLEPLAAAPSARVLTMSSGGMYTAGLTVDRLQMGPDDYKGPEQYARAKRAQVTLNEMWASHLEAPSIRFHALHPGWADTPGVEAALPGFRKVVGRLLRTPEQGADTLVWLAADDGEPFARNGRFWHDREIRSIHKLGSTRKTDTPERRRKLWEWVTDAAEIEPALPAHI